MRRLILIILAGAALLMAIGLALFFGRDLRRGGSGGDVSAPPATSPAEAAAPFVWSQKTKDAEVSLALPALLASQPDLHARLFADGVADLKRFAEGAESDRAEAEEGGAGLAPYSRQIVWSPTAETAKLLSLQKSQTDYTGGAHGGLSFDALIWDKALKRQTPPAGLFRGGADLSVLETRLCEALAVEKRARLGDDYAPPGEAWSCPRLKDTLFVLAPSTLPGKIGGLTFLFPPYAVGAYAEGAYEATVAAQQVADLIDPAYADEFAGQPMPRQGAPRPAIAVPTAPGPAPDEAASAAALPDAR